MNTGKIKKAITEMGKSSAIKSTGVFCRMWFHQPKVPAKLLEMKNAAKND